MHTVARHEASNVAVYEYHCDAGPKDRPFTESHSTYSISYVRRGSFAYRSNGDLHELVPGSLLIGYPGDEYMCSHEHHACGDDCLSFTFSHELVDEMADRRDAWRIGALPPLPEVMVIAELAQAIIDRRSTMSFDEVAYRLLSGWFSAVGGTKSKRDRLLPRDRRRVIDIARWIEASSHEDIDLDRIAQAAGMRPHHLLRTFARVLGITPHQYLIRARLRHAARLLTDEGSTITQIAGAVGFADLSNFIRTFGRAAGMSPQAFRKAAKREVLQSP